MHQARDRRDSTPSKEADGYDASFLRTEDVICLVCTSSGDAMKRGYLAAEGFGSQVCHLEPDPRDKEPCELWKCTFQLEDALSVHAMYTQGLNTRDKKQGSRKILIYGHAVLLRHMSAKKLLRCLTTSPSMDKLAYNIGFTDQPDNNSVDESCWFRVHPASKQRSEGEKVRAGDDVFLVNVANERYLSAQLSSFNNAESDSYFTSKPQQNTVQASFMQCVWALHIVCSGSAKEEAIGYVNGGDTVRLLHRHGGEDCLAVGARTCDRSIKADRSIPEVCYEPGGHESGFLLRSLWRVELFKMRFGWGFTSWGQWFRLRHVATGKFLGAVKVPHTSRTGSISANYFTSLPSNVFSGPLSMEATHVTEGKSPGERYTVALLDPSEASVDAAAFCFSNSVNGHLGGDKMKEDSMGTPQVKFGDSEVYLVHCSSGKFVGTIVSERVRYRNLRGLKKVMMQGEPHQSFVFTVTRAAEEPAKAASIIQLTEGIMRNYVHKMVLSTSEVSSHHLQDKLLCVLSDLCHYFRMPQPQSLSHDEYQQQLCVLRERQSLFQKQGMLLLTLAVIVETGKIYKQCNETTLKIHHKLYALLAAMIRGNHNNCREFATREWLTVFIQQLSIPVFTHDVLEVIQCLLTDSPEVLNIVTEDHIRALVRLLITNGRDAKVMKLLSSLCVCHGVAMRDKQRLIYNHLLTCRDLLLQTSLHDFVHCLHPNVYVGVCQGSAMYHRWYFEVEVIQLSARPKRSPHFRVGWAHASLFHPRPSSNSIITTCGGVGDDMFSLGCDGQLMWAGGHSHEPGQRRKLCRQGTIDVRPVSPMCSEGSVSVGDVIGCCLDLQQGQAWFTRNGEKLHGLLKFGPWQDMITPAISFSAGVSAVMSLGGRLGKLHYAPPVGFAALHEAVDKGVEVQLRPFLCQGMATELLVTGPAILADHQGFVPAPINTSKVVLPDPVMRVRESLARNIHKVWAKNKIEAGYSYAEVRDDNLKQTPLLKPFEDLSEGEQRYDYSMALETLSTLVALGYQISFREGNAAPLQFMELSPERYLQPNGYLPRPLNLEGVILSERLTDLVEKLAENAHNVWAASRIKEGWTYGTASNNEAKRNPLLMPYSKLDAPIKKSNWDTARESVRTICALGCSVEPPSTHTLSSINQLTREFFDSHARTRTFRGQTCYTLKKGKWYYEVKLLSDGMMRVGWATPTFPAGQLLGSDDRSYAFDGYLACKWHNGSESFGQRWKKGDIVGCLLDFSEKTMSFTLNGKLLQDSFESTTAFEQVSAPAGLVPAITLAAGQQAQLNFGRSEEALHHDYTDTGYEAVCSPASLHYNIPLWYSSLSGAYLAIDSTHPRLTVKRGWAERQPRPGPPAVVSVSCIDWDYSNHAYQECLRLNLGVTFQMPNASPTTPTIHPRPGPFSPSPTAEMDLGQVFSRCPSTAPQRLKSSYSVVIPAGQDPSTVFVGWTTAGFRYVESQFQSRAHSRSPDAIPPCQQYGQCVEVFVTHRPSRSSLRSQTKPSPVVTHSTAFLVCLASLMKKPPSHLAVPARVSCIIDAASGEMTFSCTTSVDPPHSEDSPPRHVVLMAQYTCKLFPTAIITPSSEKVIDFDFFPDPGCQSLISLLFSEQFDKKLPCCLPRMKLMALSPSRWVRRPTHMAKFSTHTATGGGLHLAANREPVYSIYATLPEEETVMDILEVSEEHKLLEFYTQTLEAYKAVCSHGNMELSASIGLILDPEQLVESLRLVGMRYSLRGAYFNLLSMLHLDPEVRTRLMMRGEFILPRSECTRSVSLFRMASQLDGERQGGRPQVRRLAMAPLPGLDYSRNNQASISHNITSTFSRVPHDSTGGFALEELKEIVFADLEELLKTGYYKGQILPCQGSYEIFVPLLRTLDQLLVMGAVQKDRDLQRLLHLLDPKEFTSSKKKSLPHGLLAADVATEEPIKLVLCDLLQHLCDCQVQHRVEAIATFAHGFVESLREEQKERYNKSFKSKPKEFRTSPEKQVNAMLSFLSGPNPDCHLGLQLQKTLRAFHKELRKHCGCTGGPSLSQGRLQELDVREKLTRLVQLVVAMKEEQQQKEGGDHVTTLQQLITRIMLEWAGQEVRQPQLIQEIFALLFRQYDEVHEVMQTLRKTYIIEVTSNSGGQPKYDIASFRRSLGILRLLLRVGMGKAEEDLLRKELQSIRSSDLFYCHPHLMRSLGVHLTVLELMRSYLGISSWGDSKVLSSRLKQKLAMSKEDLPAPVEACCQFLCKFARISPENQRALFDHIGYLLEHSEKHPGLMTYQGSTPLDVVTATIKDNQELALALEETHLEHVVSLLVATTTSMNDSDMDDPLGTVTVGSMSCDWAPNGGEKCLEFLQSAIWVDNEQILENAYVVVRLLIRNSECLGPALAGEALGLCRVYEEAVEHMDETSSHHLTKQESIAQTAAGSSVQGLHHSASFLSLSLLNARLVLSFYTSLVRLLACCAPSPTRGPAQPSPAPSQLGAFKQQHSNAERTLSILQNMVKVEEIVGILSIPFSTDSHKGLLPTHKEAALLFLDRVYHMMPQELLLRLLTDAFLPDIKMTLGLTEMSSQQELCAPLCRYICCSVLPLLTRHAAVFRQLMSHLHVVDSLLACCLRFAYITQLSYNQLEALANFLITITKELHPKAILRYMPKLIASIDNLQPSSIVALKLLTSHYKHFMRYYESGMLVMGRSCLGLAGEEEKTCSAIIVDRLLNALSKKLPSDSQQLQLTFNCLCAVSCAMGPDSLIPSRPLLATMYCSSSSSYEPRPVNIGRVVLPPELQLFLRDFASYLHDCWIYEKQSVGWVYGPELSEDQCQHPNIRSFHSLPEQERVGLLRPAEEAIKYLLARRWTLSKVRPVELDTLPTKPQMTCIRPKKRRAQSLGGEVEGPYQPKVVDLTKVEMPVELRAVAEQMAENAHDKWAKELKNTDSDYLSHTHFRPYELLDEAVMEERRCYALDLLRYLRVSGFELSLSRVSLSSLSEGTQATTCREKFALQFFQKFLDLLTQGLNSDFYLKVLFPVTTSYLAQHAGYFMPSSEQRGHSFASKEEKLLVLKLFCRVMEFTRRNLADLFPNKTHSVQFLTSPQHPRGPLESSDSDANYCTARGIFSFLESCIRALDAGGLVKSPCGSVENCKEIVDFFREATSGVHLTAQNIAKLDKVNDSFHFYCMRVLIPTLSTLFTHLGFSNTGRHLIVGPVMEYCKDMFRDLVAMAMGSGPVFVGSSPLIAIGKCMGAFASAYPEPFLDKKTFDVGTESLISQLERATSEGVTCGNVLYVVDVIVPVLARGVSSSTLQLQVDQVLTYVLSLMAAHFGQSSVKWIYRIIESTLMLSTKCSLLILSSHFIPLMDELREKAIRLWQDEQYLSASWSSMPENDSATDRLQELVEDYRIYVRDLLCILPYLAIFLVAHTEDIREDACCHSFDAEGCEEPMRQLFVSIADIFHCWFSSKYFRREYQTSMQWLFQGTRTLRYHPFLVAMRRPGEVGKGGQPKKTLNLITNCLELLLPLNNRFISQEDRDLVEQYRMKFRRKGATSEDLKVELVKDLERKAIYAHVPLAHKVVRQISRTFSSTLLTKAEKTLQERALKILSLATVRHRIYQLENPSVVQRRWKQLFSQRKKNAVIKCFLAVPFYQLPMPRAINLFLQAYCSTWLMNAEHANHKMLTEELLDHQDFLALQRKVATPDPLSQLFTMFKRTASASGHINESLYTAYIDVISKTVIGFSEDDSRTDDDNVTKAYELYYQQMAEFMVRQGQLAKRGAPTMLLQVITAYNGNICPVVHSTLRLGIALLKEGNEKIQHEMLTELKGMDVGFLSSISKLITSCSVLNWNAYERYNKSEPVHTSSTTTCSKVLPESAFTVSLFRFLQLLCEGHNQAFQDYLRTQAGNTTTVNIIIYTVDYLLRLQESISDFYWHYSDHDTIDLSGRENFLKAFKVAKQVFRTLTEYIQGPCVRNQEALAHSRLWDAVSGFLHIFAELERKLYKETSQMELLRELLGLQEEMFILLLSMLEGSAMSSNIGKLMVDMLVESAQSIKDIMSFFAIFVKLKDVTTSKAFKEYDQNKDGLISYREFEMAMEAQQSYSKEEIAYLMECADTNKDGLLDYSEFTERFHQPAESIGFHLCVLIVHLSDHLPNDHRLKHFRESTQGKGLIDHFQQSMGCIEILGKSGRIERVYFEVKESYRKQWEETQIQESKRAFLRSVETGSQKSKLQGFINFCEDTIFEMDYADKISGTEQREKESRAEQHRRKHNRVLQLPSQPFLSRIRAHVQAFRHELGPLQKVTWLLQRVISWLTILWTFILTRVLPACKAIFCVLRSKASSTYTSLRQHPVENVSSSGPTTQQGSLRKRVPLKINIPAAQETATQSAGVSRDRRSNSFDPAATYRKSPVTTTGDSGSMRRGSYIPSPRTSQMRQLNLAYDRSRMKPPSGYLDTASPPPSSGPLGADRTESYMPKIRIAARGWQSFLARHYYRLDYAKLILTFFINILLLTFRVPTYSKTGEPQETDETVLELGGSFWNPLFLRSFSVLHFLLSAVLIISYWHLKVPLIIFKREKQIARQLEDKLLWVRNSPSKPIEYWDGIVISAASFPHKYWDKQVKQRVCNQFPEDKRPTVVRRLGMEVASKYEERSTLDIFQEILTSLVDLRYKLWMLGVVLSNKLVLYHILYCGLSFMGLHWNSFYFSIHLLDLVMSFKVLQTVLRSVLHNGKQLIMTVLMTCVVIYIYTVIAFNFFRKFYRQQTPMGEKVYQCESMARCFIYHVDQGLRSGGGIADVLESATGDPNEFLRLFFDITFFFFVIVILLAIIQGLIIDAFGELRDKEEAVTTEMQTKCFVCGLPKTDFDHIPHGFDNHISREHSMAHYMFFLLYLIKKQESEFSGQESYVWELYLKRKWDFFPVGDCFHHQEEGRKHNAQQKGKKSSHLPGMPRKALTIR